MRNRVISYSLREFEVFLKVPMIIIIVFHGNNVFMDNKYRYISISGVCGGVHGSSYISRCIVRKSEKISSARTILKSNFTSF